MSVGYTIGDATIYHGDVREQLAALPNESVQTVVTSPPYWGLRDYGVEGQIGLEPTPEAFIETMVGVFREVRRVLRDDGTCWINIGDSYASGAIGGSNVGEKNTLSTGSKSGYHTRPKTENETAKRRPVPYGLKPKDLVGIPWMLAFALRADGWYLRSEIIWHKKNPMPESVTDRPTKAHEQIFLLSKSPRYYYDAEAIKEQVEGGAHARVPGNHAHAAADAYGKGDEKHRTKGGLVKFSERKRAEAGSGIKNNTSMDAALTEMVDRRNKRSVWTVASQPFSEAHFATFPPKLIEPCILAGAAPGAVVLDPFHGAGTTGMVALEHGRAYVGIELNADYIAMSVPRLEHAIAQGRLFA